MNVNNINITKTNMAQKMEEKYMNVLNLELEDYTPDDQRILLLFWLGFLLGYVRTKPMENIIEMMAEEYFEEKNLLPESIELLNVNKYRINEENIYALNYRIHKGYAFIYNYFKDDAVILSLKDGSKRIASEIISEDCFRVYLNEDKMNDLYSYLNDTEIYNKNLLRDTLVKFYSLYHINLPSFHSYLSKSRGITITGMEDFESMISNFKSFTSNLIYFWAKDQIQEGDSANIVCKSLKFKNINADILKKFISYLFELKFKKVRDTINPILNTNDEIHSIRLPLVQYPLEGKYAYNNFPGISINGNVNTGRHMFKRNRLTNNTISKILTSNTEHDESYIDISKMKSFNIVKENPDSFHGLMYVDVSFSMGNLFNQFMHGYFNIQFKNELERILNDTLNTENSMGDDMILTSNYYYSVLRIQFEHLSNGYKLRDIVNHQKYSISVPFLIYFSNNDNFSIYEPHIFNCLYTYKFDEELLNTPISDFLHPENFSVHVDLAFEKNIEDEHVHELIMLIKKIKN